VSFSSLSGIIIDHVLCWQIGLNLCFNSVKMDVWCGLLCFHCSAVYLYDKSVISQKNKKRRLPKVHLLTNSCLVQDLKQLLTIPAIQEL